MAKTKCVVCDKFLGFDIGLGHHPNGQPHQKTKDGKWTCGPVCARDYNLQLLNGGGGASSNSGSNQSQSSNEEKKSGGGFLSGLMGGGDSSAKVEQVKLFGSLLADSMDENKQIREKVDAVSKMVFSTNADELANQMNELLTIGAGTDSKHKELLKACYEKMDFGVMKLKSLGATAEADFFAEKRKSIKPKGMFGF